MLYLRTAFDMVGFAVELPLRWKSLGLKPELPVHTKIGYGLMLNAVTDMWLLTSGVDRKAFDPNSITVVKNFIGYMNTIDDYLDDPRNKGSSLRFGKGHELWGRRKDLFMSVGQYDVSMQKQLKRVISASTYTMLSVTARFNDREVSSLDDAIALREGTARELARVTAELFNVIHGVPEDTAKAIEQAYGSIGMAMQVWDDVGDVGKDAKDGTGENMILQMLNQRADEKARLMDALAGRKSCGYSTLVRYAPETARAARELQDHYLGAIPDKRGFNRIRLLINLTVSLHGRPVVLSAIIDKLDL
jgi:hypothetical protein